MGFKMVAADLDGKVICKGNKAEFPEGDSRNYAVTALVKKFFTAIKQKTDSVRFE